MDANAGLTLETMAATMSKHHELRAQHGEPGFKPHFLAYLGSQGLDEPGWAQAWDAWRARLDADASGQLWAQFHRLEGQLGVTEHVGEVEDTSQQVRGGLTLELFARVSAELTQPGAELNTVLARHDVTVEVWNLGRAAWTGAMREDAGHGIAAQYEQLIAKHDPAHAAAQAGEIVANLTAAPRLDEHGGEYSVERALRETSSPAMQTRWRAAHSLAQKIRTELAGDENRQNVALMACVPQLIEALEQHDRETIACAEAAARDLVELDQFTEEAKGAISRCVLRGQERLAALHEALALIQDKDVPERIPLQAEIDEYTALVEGLEEILGEWDEKAGREPEIEREMLMGKIAGPPETRAEDGKRGIGGLFKKIVALFRG